MSTPAKSPFGPRETQRILARRKKWVDALRSGKFKQGRGALRSPDGSFCCLGVADEVCKLKDPSSYLLRSTGAKLGLNQELQHQLYTMNDVDRVSFCEIAKAIETLPIVKGN